ncbi:hypothetical protein AVEN_37917-1 [Araneus ventricosus]|uniref:Uncharacterized protein n=1 Tax=Araneus ventricosus TaxID=182803 RepID=A0A4Y2WAJ4_ARAVE|nr:hypothetical protein AVEN_251226-1 [Araneus ventricosus]GBO34663.1 hypothetical protein AVEN_255048-1 [Araneus ventricosus]GBO35612.1 hypothetical protein AVEN_11825-1 [Araneus ventricosus]GBO35614.1 hypothetical protein AVEN_37917-1 [Araneus ventricosus]
MTPFGEVYEKESLLETTPAGLKLLSWVAIFLKCTISASRRCAWGQRDRSPENGTFGHIKYHCIHLSLVNGLVFVDFRIRKLDSILLYCNHIASQNKDRV